MKRSQMSNCGGRNPLSMRIASNSAHGGTGSARGGKPVPNRLSPAPRIGQRYAPQGTNPAPSGSKRVANPTAERVAKVRAWLAVFAIGLLFWILLFGSLFAAGAFAKCHTHRCWHRVSVRRHLDYAWRWVKAHPMPYCTWAYESGLPYNGYGPYAARRYRVTNASSTAAGKYQMLDQSAHAVGIPDFPGTHDAAKASPLQQERAARRLLLIQGPGAWARC